MTASSIGRHAPGDGLERTATTCPQQKKSSSALVATYVFGSLARMTRGEVFTCMSYCVDRLYHEIELTS